MQLQAIVICNKDNIGINVLLESLKAYCPDIPVYLSSQNYELSAKVNKHLQNVATNFGDAYNAAMQAAFDDGFDEIIIANDDVVITPTTIQLLKEDVEIIKSYTHKIGFVGARSDYVLWEQNIRSHLTNDAISGLKWESESKIKRVGVIAPIFAYINKYAFEVAQFPSINWYSDNIICDDLTEKGFMHFVSRAYVHHAGSQTVGTDYEKCHEEPREWIKANRPDKYGEYYG